jgi:hypothetical protein
VAGEGGAGGGRVGCGGSDIGVEEGVAGELVGVVPGAGEPAGDVGSEVGAGEGVEDPPLDEIWVPVPVFNAAPDVVLASPEPPPPPHALRAELLKAAANCRNRLRFSS